MQIFVPTLTGKTFSLECESTDTILHIKEKLQEKSGIPLDQQTLVFREQRLGFSSMNKTLADIGIQEKDKLYLTMRMKGGAAGEIERPGRGHLHYVDAFKHGWREEHGEAFMNYLWLELSRDGGMQEGNITEEAWLQIQNAINNSTNCNFEMDFLKERLRDYQKLYSLLTDTSFPLFNRREKIISPPNRDNWFKYSELFLVCGGNLPYFDTLEKVCQLLSTRQSSQQQFPITSKKGGSFIGSLLNFMR